MMKIPIRIEGVYDLKLFQSLKQMLIAHLTFDFRAQSFNFLQQYKFLEMMRDHGSPFDNYFLHFKDEQAYIIQKNIDDLRLQIINDQGQGLSLAPMGKNFCLEFSDFHEVEFYEQFALPFYWHYHPNSKLEKMISSSFCRGVVLSYGHLFQLHESGNFFKFVTDFMKIARQQVEAGKIELILSLDWGSDLFPSIFDFLPISICSLPINHKVESSYRVADIEKISNEIKHFQSIAL